MPAPIASAPGTIVRSFQSSNGGRPGPRGAGGRRRGPRLSSRIASAARASSGGGQHEQHGGRRGRRARGSRRTTVPAQRMRILYLHQFFITRAGVGGTRSYEFARRFAARGHAVRMVTAGGRRAGRVDGIEVVGVRGGYSDYVSATALSLPAPDAGLRALRARRHARGAARARGPT